MALVKCKECGNQVSTEAKACPSCGAAPHARASYLWLFLGLPVGAVVLFLGVGFLNMTPEKSKGRAEIERCWKSVDAQMPFSTPRRLATQACQQMVSDYESKHGRAPSLRHE